MYEALIKFKGVEPPLPTELRDVFVQKWEEVENDPNWTQKYILWLKKVCKSEDSIIDSDSD